MRLLYIDEGEFKLTEDLDRNIPSYAILSHTWGPDTEEVTFQDLLDGSGRDKPGFDKIEFCAAQAKNDGLQYFWVDTCCIDKSNNAELSDAINSMFRWYQNAARCYVYLSDDALSDYERDNQQSKHIWAAFRASLWFTRGWTLQELLAPASVEFFTKKRQRLGDKISLVQQIHGITGIAIPALQGSSLASFSIKERFQWANKRETKREEDWAYCLQGIFGVFMPLMYGEGKANAIYRLEKQITKNQECLEDLRATDPRDDKQRIEQAKGGLLHDCYKWILGNNDFQRWQNGQDQLIWVRGDPGKGKTMLLCGIINHLEELPAANVSYFFCQATDKRINTATAVLRGLIFLLVNQQPLLIRHIRDKYDQAGRQLFEDANAWVALSAIFKDSLQDPGPGITYFVIDALDECVTGLNDLLHLIIQTSTANSRVKWVVSSRNWPSIEKAFSKAQNLGLSLELNEKSVSAAVATYIEFKTETLAKDNDYDFDTQDIVKHYLMQNASGTFLWVALVCQELAHLSAWEVDQERLTMFPPGLDSLYKRMMEQIEISRHPQLCKSILATLSVVYRPITLDELPSLIEIPPRAVGKDKALSQIVGTCGSFLSLRDRTIFFTHQSAKDFLTEKNARIAFPSGIRIRHQTILTRSIQAMSKILQKDIYNLQHPGISIEEVKQQCPVPDPLAPIRYTCVYWHEHLCETQEAPDNAIIETFLRKHFLHWFEALSILGSTSQCVLALSKTISLLQKSAPKSQLVALVQDMLRFARSYRGIIEKAPLQAYSSALVFSPTNSLTRKIFQGESPSWIVRKPQIEEDWNACLTTLEGHSGPVTCVAFSPDGRRIASGSDDETVRVWDAESGECSATLEGHSDSVTCVAFSPDGRRIASGSGDETVRVWDAESGECLAILEGHSNWVTCIAFSPDSRCIASGSGDKTIRVWDAESGKCLATFKGHSNGVTCIAFSPNGRHIASGSGDKTVRVWDAESGKCSATLKGHSNGVTCIAFSPDGRRIASGSDDVTIRVWDAESGKCSATLEGHSDRVTCVAFSPDGRRIASGSDDETVRVWDAESSECSATLEGHSDSVTCVAFSPDGRRIASGSGDETVRVWDAESGECLAILEGHSNWVTCVAFSPDGRRIASSSGDETVRVWDAESGECITMLQTME